MASGSGRALRDLNALHGQRKLQAKVAKRQKTKIDHRFQTFRTLRDFRAIKKMARETGLEPATSGVTGRLFSNEFKGGSN